MNGLTRELFENQLGRRRLGRRAHPRRRRPALDGRALHAREGRRGLRRRRRRRTSRGADLRRERGRAVHGAAGLLPVAPGHGGVGGGQQPAPAARDDRPPRRGRPADERPAHRAEQPRVRRRRRPARLPELGQPGTRAAARRRVGRRRDDDPALGAAHPRDADLPYAEAGIDRSAVDLRDQPGRLDAGVGADPRILGGDQCFVVVQDLFLTETAELADVVLPAAGWGEKTGMLHQRQPDGPPVREGRRPTGRGAQRPGHLPDVRRRDGLHEQDGRAADRLAYPRGGLRRLDASAPPAGPSTTRASPTTGSAAPPASRGR